MEDEGDDEEGASGSVLNEDPFFFGVWEVYFSLLLLLQKHWL